MSYFNTIKAISQASLETPVVKNLTADQSGALNVRLSGTNLSAFGDLISVDMTPVVQLDFVYGINIQTGTTTKVSTATADTINSRLRLQTSTSSTGSAIFRSVRPARYRPGQGMLARFTWAFTTGVASSTQITGVGNSIDGYCFGFNGTSFGILHRNNSSDTWITQANWNKDVCDGTGESLFDLDPTLGNVYAVRYPYLGYGTIDFFILSPAGFWIHVHSIQYPNTSTTLQITNPNLFFYAEVTNSGNTSNLIGYGGSVGIFITGKREFLGPVYGRSNRKTGITTETNIITIKNCTTYNGATNRGLIRLKSLSIGADANTSNTVLLNAIKDTTLGGSPSYTTVNGTTADGGATITSGNSIASFDTAGTTITGGTIQFNLSGMTGSSEHVDLTPFDLFIEPGSIMTFAVTGDSSSNIRVSVNWVEEI